MAEMVLMKCESEARVALVLCPVCNRISKQILRSAYDSSKHSYGFIKNHVCPVCNSSYVSCNPKNQDKCSFALTMYEMNSDQYNKSVKARYTLKQTEETDPAFSSANTPSDESWNVTTPFSAELDRKIEYWKRELLDTGKRNKMINYRETKRSTLKILEPQASVLFNRLISSEKALTFQKPINKDTDLRTYAMISLMETLSYTLNVQVGDIKTAGTIIEREKTLKNLRSKAKLAQEEQGINILYLCFGFIYWKAQSKDSSPWFKAPLLLMPVSLGLKSLNSPYTLSRYDDEIEVNPTLDYLFHTEYNIDLPRFEYKNENSFDEYLAQIEEIVDKRGWKVFNEVSLGLLSFLKISMYHDLENNRKKMISHPVLMAMAGDHEALGDLPDEAKHFDFDAIQPGEWHEVVDADSSQEEAILLSKLGVSFVMQGPPGTGKSQTITNIIAEAIADGKKVLFVSEKAAALEVVLKRLTEVHLDDFCLSLHNYKANKKEIIDSIGANLQLGHEYVDDSVMNELTELFHDREFLTKYANDLHRIIEPLGESVYMAFGKLSNLATASHVSFEFHEPASVTKAQYSSLLYIVSAFENALHNMGGTLDSNPWYGTVAQSSDQLLKQQMLRETEGLSDCLRELNNKASTFNSEYHSTLGKTMHKLKAGMDALNGLFTLPMFPYWWTDTEKQENLLNRMHQEMHEQNMFMEQMRKNRETYIDASLNAPLDDWNDRSKRILGTYNKIKYARENADNHRLTHAIQNLQAVKDLLADLTTFSNLFTPIAKQLGLGEIDSFKNAKVAVTVNELLAQRPDFHETIWYNRKSNSDALELVDTARQHATRLKAFSSDLLSVWAESVRKLNLDEIQTVFDKKYEWMYHGSSINNSVHIILTNYINKTDAFMLKVTSITDALSRANSVLGINRNDTLEDLHSVASLLRKTSESPYLETIWFNTRKIEAVKPLLEDANAHYAKITELKNHLLSKWEPEALNMEGEAIAMLGRFKTEYVGAFHRMKSGFKADMKAIKLLSREVKKSIDEAEVVALLQSLKEIHDEQQWFKEKDSQLKELAGSYYQGVNTDWNSVNQGIQKAAEISSSFPFGNIPEEIITSIQHAASDIHNAAEIKELATLLSEEHVTEIESLLNEATYIEGVNSKTTLRNEIIPGIAHFLDLCRKEDMLAAELQKNYIFAAPITYQDISDLISNENDLQTEEKWFTENKNALNHLFASKNQGPNSDFDAINSGLLFAQVVLLLFTDQIPEELISIFCSDTIPGECSVNLGDLSDQSIDNLMQRLQLLAPYPYSDTDSITRTMIPTITTWVNITEQLVELHTEIQPFQSNNECTIEQLIKALPQAIHAKGIRNQILKQETDLSVQLGTRYQGIHTDWQSITSDLCAVKNYLEKCKSSDFHDFLRIICANAQNWSQAKKDLEDMLAIHSKAETALAAFSSYFEGGEQFIDESFDSLAEKYDKCMSNFSELSKWLDYVEARKDCDAKGLGSFTEAIVKKNNTITDVCNAFERGFYTQWLSCIINSVPAVKTFKKRVHEQHSERFIRLDTKQYDIARKRIREKIINSFPDMRGISRARSEEGILLREMEKKRRIMPLRKLFQSIPDLLLTLKPCLMMSPLSVAYFLDADLYKFDMVIFDEASQVFPQDAIGAIFRADQVIIAGDTQQLPPTNFFASTTGNNEEEYDNDEDYDSEIYDSRTMHYPEPIIHS